MLASAKKTCEELPSKGLLSETLVELKAVSSVHAVEELLKDDVSDHTLHSDGTTMCLITHYTVMERQCV